MSTYGQGEYRSGEVAGDLTTYQYRFMKLDSTGRINLCDASSTRHYGVLQNAPAYGEVACVKVSGETLLDATRTAGFSIGNLISSTTIGKGAVATAGGYANGIVRATSAPNTSGLFDSSRPHLITVELMQGDTLIP